MDLESNCECNSTHCTAGKRFDDTQLTSLKFELTALALPYAVSAPQTNGVRTLVVFPTGGKKGWSANDTASLARENFLQLVKQMKVPYIEVKYGDVCPHVASKFGQASEIDEHNIIQYTDKAIRLCQEVLDVVRYTDLGPELVKKLEDTVSVYKEST